ncbi:uncharacterized protein LOC142167823 [Nicotiana tabacum]|uniref:Uncharacterized protein LOC142167823 n=1 Tax=Nicotiana tabacum TaxID=4097 RepID=A0AC58SGC3_TOBAC
MICPNIQKDIVSSCAKETLKAIAEDLNGDYFGILVDESKDVSHKEQMALVLRYVNKEGKVIERFLSIVHVKDTSAKLLKEAIYSLLLKHSWSKSQIRGQGYDGASNMEILRDEQAEKLEQLLVLGEVHTGSGLNQELGLQRAGDTRWGFYFKTMHNFISLFSSIVHVLRVLAIEGSNYHERSMAKSLMDDIRSYDFVYMLHLMLKVLALTYDLNMALRKKDQNIISAMKLVGFAKRQLQDMRDSRWNSLIEDVSLFCVKHGIVIPEMDINYVRGKSKRKKSSITYSYHLHVEVFYAIIYL